ncbi:SET domain-containing protein [Tilletiaria anomala UBC 951]|uniref:Histone-lysine N-methyltransferase, H3 lysine-36 specific n=1 Tax=Tilletiaria anomala (strain ATCC 24038 / CBS 436.72 / UBC 951) TaxID=1037660 RepID=A0A066VM78_TILAU|nr:SET domain-containing protein [Tilletiaria anomala UBC 951]KDN39839.1 SET domain-containing protein [Tilletiaria anomala UBC 951]
MDDGTDVKPTKRRSKHESGAQLVTHLPKVDEEALETFREVESNVYFSNKIGRSKGQMDGMVCDCVFNPKQLSGLVACGDEAECINRLTQIECCEETCLCREHCQNLRFQKKQYAQVDIVRTEKKGFGLRATYGIEADAFVYEYIGEIIPQNSFLKRMQAYKDEGLEHFYFMALAREEYIDATKVGGKARFINHSCNPNCYVSKWHVGKHMRMGIFAKRPIIAGEELSFNYNVDRYGNDAQPCYCGEPNCVGTIGGKTQTDVAGMDDLFIDALGISDEVDMAGARGSKQKKSKQLGIDFTPTLSPVPKEDVAMVVNATRQATSNPRILPMLLTRIQLTSEPDVNRAFVQLHGLVLMAGVLEEWKDNKDVVMLALGCLARWPMIARNKVNDTGIAAQVKELVSSSDADIAEVATSVSDMWNALTVGYRIARRESGQGFADDPMVWPGAAPLPVTMLKTVADAVTQDAPTDVAMQEPTEAEMREEAICEAQFWPARQATPSISAIINRAKQRAELERRMQEEALASAQASAIAAADRALRKQARVLPTDSSRPHKRRRKEIARQTVKTPERKLYKQIGELIVATMSKHKKSFEKESFKRHAKELTELICAKELKKAKEREWPPKDGQVTLSEEKRGKMKKFAKEYIAKIIAHKEKVAAVAKAKTQREQKEGGKLRADEEAGVEGML